MRAGRAKPRDRKPSLTATRARLLFRTLRTGNLLTPRPTLIGLVGSGARTYRTDRATSMEAHVSNSDKMRIVTGRSRGTDD
jgi:hypothetical protein